jgi:hypothetical protein
LTDGNKNPEQIARDAIDKRLRASGWAAQGKKSIDHDAAAGIAITEYTTSIGPADYVLFSEKRALGVVEAKPDSWGAKITTVEEQSSGYATAQLKWVKNSEPLNFIYEATGVLTRFTDARDPKPRSREVFSFHRPETLRAWAARPKSFRAALQDLPLLKEARNFITDIADAPKGIEPLFFAVENTSGRAAGWFSAAEAMAPWRYQLASQPASEQPSSRASRRRHTNGRRPYRACPRRPRCSGGEGNPDYRCEGPGSSSEPSAAATGTI